MIGPNWVVPEMLVVESSNSDTDVLVVTGLEMSAVNGWGKKEEN